MSPAAQRPISGHVFRIEGARRPVWRAKYRLPDGRQVQRTIGPAWTERGRPAGGYFTKRTANSEQGAAIYLTAALTGLRRGELVALGWRDVDFTGHPIRVRASYTEGGPTTPKSGKVRSVPMAPQVATALAKLASRSPVESERDLVFAGTSGAYLDASALYRRYKRALADAGLRSLRFHDLRHTFGTRTIGKASILQVKAWMGHADVATTMKYLHYAPRAEEARLVAEAFSIEEPGSAPASFHAACTTTRTLTEHGALSRSWG